MTYVRRERDWLERAQASGRTLDPGRLLPMLPAGRAHERQRRWPTTTAATAMPGAATRHAK